MRKASVERKTNETNINLSISFSGGEKREISSGIGFFDHMLDLFFKHSRIDVQLECKGDTNVDAHHTVEDIGIALGQAFAQALSDKRGIARYANISLPMDETLIDVAIDISGRPFLAYNVCMNQQMVGEFDSDLCEEFFRAFAFNAGITLHINLRYGKNAHHIVEAAFKAVARALAIARKVDESNMSIPSTKGVI